MQLTDKQIDHMVKQFLGWALPENFSPDGGITFDPIGNLGTDCQYRRTPIGTNLLNAEQAREMVKAMVAALPDSPPASVDEFTRKRWKTMEGTQQHNPVTALEIALDDIRSGKRNPKHVIVVFSDTPEEDGKTIPPVGWYQAGQYDHNGQVGLLHTVAAFMTRDDYPQ